MLKISDSMVAGVVTSHRIHELNRDVLNDQEALIAAEE